MITTLNSEQGELNRLGRIIFSFLKVEFVPFVFLYSLIEQTSTILGQEVAERVLEDVHVRAGYILGILFVLLIQKYFILSYFILFYFILPCFILLYFILFYPILFLYIILFYFISFYFMLIYFFILLLSSVPVRQFQLSPF